MESIRTLRAVSSPLLIVNSSIETTGGAPPAELDAATYLGDTADPLALACRLPDSGAKVLDFSTASPPSRLWAWRVPAAAKLVRLQFLLGGPGGGTSITGKDISIEVGLYSALPGLGRGDGNTRVGRSPLSAAKVMGRRFSLTLTGANQYLSALTPSARSDSPFTGEDLLDADGEVVATDLDLYVADAVLDSSYSADNPTLDAPTDSDVPVSVYIDPSFCDLIIIGVTAADAAITHLQACAEVEVN